MTVITLVPRLHVNSQELRAAFAFFPLVGLILGALLALLQWAVTDIWGPEVIAPVLVVALAMLTRGLHLDGLCDTADAIGSRAPVDKALVIMKDSCTGALGVLALVCVMLLKTAGAFSLVKASAWQYFILIPCLSRWSLNCLGSLTTYARGKPGLGTAFCGPKTRPSLVVAALTGVAASWFLLKFTGLYLFAASALAAVISAWYFNNRFGGVTGDCLGAHLEAVETLLFLAGAALCR